jgi:hypothetical protein
MRAVLGSASQGEDQRSLLYAECIVFARLYQSGDFHSGKAPLHFMHGIADAYSPIPEHEADVSFYIY